MPKVSVIVPIYNAQKYLNQCLDSIIGQTLKDIEIICINDGSTDNSLNILKEYAAKDDRIIVVNKPNTGYGHTMNVGLEHATGEYIGIVESDDFVDLEMFEQIYDIAKKNSAEVVKSNYFEYKNKSNTFIENLKDCKYNNIFSPMEEQNVFFVSPSIWSGIYKRSLLINNNIKFNETPGASYQDTSFAFKVWASAKRVYLVNEAFLHYRKDNMDSSVNSASKIFCICDEYEEIEKYSSNYKSIKMKLGSLIYYMKFVSYKWNYNRLASTFQYAFLLRMAEELKIDYENGLLNKKYWNKQELKELQCIINNPDEYFKDTAKDYNDNRLMLCGTLNLQLYKQGFLDCISKYKHVIIFGAGVIGKKVGQALIFEKKSKNILCFAVSNLKGNNESLFGVPVKCIKDLSEYTNESLVLVSIKEKDQYEVIKMLKSLNFHNIVSIDSNLLKTLVAKG